MPNKHKDNVIHGVSLFGEMDLYLFREGSHARLYSVLGSHVTEAEGKKGTIFSVWAPNARAVSVMGDFNGWNTTSHPLAPRWDGSGIWEGFIPGVGDGALYKYGIISAQGEMLQKGDPFAFSWEEPPKSASRVFSIDDYSWRDEKWMLERPQRQALNAPFSIYEVHLGSWQRMVEEGGRFLTYSELALRLVNYVLEMGFTHVEFMPVMEHPFYGSWGYQTVGYFAPTARYGAPQEFMALVDAFHAAGIGVILDWVPSHFPTDAHGLSRYDGTCLYEHEDPRKGFHPDWKSSIFNYGRNEVRSFLLSSAHFWVDRYHADGLRVDAVASMLYLDYSRKDGEWIPNEFGGRENLEAIEFIRKMNASLYADYPGVQVIAEESTSWPMVSRPNWLGGLGFGLKWNMGWMHDTLSYFSRDPIYRKYHQNNLTFGMWYAYTENFMLPLSHDEVVHGKGSLYSKMPGDTWQKLANLRLLQGWQYVFPGKKLLFMGGEFGQIREWNHDDSLDWHLLHHWEHNGVRLWMADLNHFYKTESALWAQDFERIGFQWVDCGDQEASVLSFLRRDGEGRILLCVANFTPVPRTDYRIGVPEAGVWAEVLNSDAEFYGGGGWGNRGEVTATHEPRHGYACSVSLTLPALSLLIFRYIQ